MKTAEKTAAKPTEKTIYRHKGWSVVRNEDGDYEVRNSGGSEVETFVDAKAAAIELCHDWGEQSYPDQLWHFIQEFTRGDYRADKVKVETLEKVAALLGIDVDGV